MLSCQLNFFFSIFFFWFSIVKVRRKFKDPAQLIVISTNWVRLATRKIWKRREPSWTQLHQGHTATYSTFFLLASKIAAEILSVCTPRRATLPYLDTWHLQAHQQNYFILHLKCVVCFLFPNWMFYVAFLSCVCRECVRERVCHWLRISGFIPYKVILCTF